MNNVLASGEVSNLFARDEVDEITQDLIGAMKRQLPRCPPHPGEPLRLLPVPRPQQPPRRPLLLTGRGEVSHAGVEGEATKGETYMKLESVIRVL